VSLKDSAATGDRLAALRDLRDVLAESIVNCQSLRDLSSLSGRLQSVLEEIALLEGPREAGDGIDEIAQRRAARRAGAGKGSVRSGG
jgi:hypothetical protein